MVKKLPADCMPMCRTCAFRDQEEGYYICRRLPPQYVISEAGNAVLWPTVNLDDWCGEYKRRTNG